ncbi:AmmeMemoRadiSam system radical SAM enzyme [Syntrophomonas curvata]
MEAQFYEKRENRRVKCLLCPHHCSLHEGQEGLCRVRVNREGELISLNYGEVASLALDPIEKKPLFHFHPGKLILSAGTFGCNLACAFCQNYSLAHEIPPTSYLDTAALLDIARQAEPEGSVGVAFTYNEPSVWYEYIRAAAPKLKERGFKVVLVSNGYIDPRPLEEMLPWVDAVNIDLKAFNDEFYRRHCRGRLAAVLETVEKAAAATHVEITTLLIPEENDDSTEISNLAHWLAAINPDMPLHLSRYHPAYKFNQAPTPLHTLQAARETAREHLNFVYLGNIPGEQNLTLCLNCGGMLISRTVYDVNTEGLKDGCCRYCGSRVDYIVI